MTMPGKGRFPKGVHPAGHKELAADRQIEVLPTPALLHIPLLQHTGAPCDPVVAPKAEVLAGQKIAEAKSVVSAPIHTPVSGVVNKVGVTTLPNGRHVKTLVIQPAAQQPEADALLEDLFGGEWPLKGLEMQTPETILAAVREGGLVGQGGAAFPTAVKLARNAQKPVDTVLVNGCECEPYLTSDYRMMVEFPEPILTGALLAARASGAKQIYIAVEDNKPAALEALARAAAGTDIRVVGVGTRYPMGGEKQTVRAVMGRTIPTGGLPLDVGVVVINVSTAASIARAVLRGKALTHRVVSVTGAGIAQPRNVLAPVGAPIQDLIAFCGGLKPEAARVIAGGPMMGFTLGSLDTPVTKGTSGIVVLTADDLRRSEETTCVRCGRCVDVCPLNLVPTRIALAARNKDWDTARRYHMQACMECGCCAYGCPAGLPLVQLIRMGKAQMLKEAAKK